MESLRIDAGVVRLLINDGPESISFNPTDVIFVEKFYKVLGEFEAKMAEYQEKAKTIDDEVGLDSNGVPVNIDARLTFLSEVCNFANEQIDYLFGEGTHVKLFGGTESLDMIVQFFENLMPFIETARAGNVAKYQKGIDRGKKTLK